jgi:hypothetical protein
MGQRIGDTLDLVLTAVTANTTLSVPAGYAVRDIFVRNTTANAVTGGVKIGTTSGAVDVLGALTVGANAFTLGVPLIRLFSATVAQTLFVQAVVAWNSASLDITITLDRAIP